MSTARRIEREAYKPEETVTFKLPFIQPYGPVEGQFEAASGSLEYGGEFYRLVKQKLQADTLYVVAIKDVGEKMISGFMSDFVKESSDISGGKTFKLLSEFAKDYVASATVIIISQSGWSYELAPTFAVTHLSSVRVIVETPPPDAA